MDGYRYKVFLVDDEPASLQLISNIIRMSCSELEITKTAGSAAECLAALERDVPDILISDIRMPGANGIDLIAAVQKTCPDVVSVLVSGYQEFEYARAAMKLDVEEYLLKPIVPDEFCQVMRRVEKKVDRLFQNKRSAILAGTEAPENGGSSRYFPDGQYYAAVIRKNGLPRRFISGGAETQRVGPVRHEQDIILGGRDMMETIYLVPAKLVEDQDLFQLLGHVYERERQNASYVTAVLTRECFAAADIPEKIKELQECLDDSLVIGLDQIVYVEEKKRNRAGSGFDYRGVLRKLEKYLEEDRMKKAREELALAGEYAVSCQVSQKELERVISLILMMLTEYVKSPGDGFRTGDFEEVLANAADMREIFAELSGFLDQAADRNAAGKLDSPEFIGQIIRYLKHHLTDDISMKTIARMFGISQTYLGQLFQKHRQVSYSGFVTELRITQAKRLLESDPSMLVRDVAALSGYEDQFYFSRVFRNATGMTPTEYTARIPRG